MGGAIMRWWLDAAPIYDSPANTSYSWLLFWQLGEHAAIVVRRDVGMHGVIGLYPPEHSERAIWHCSRRRTCGTL